MATKDEALAYWDAHPELTATQVSEHFGGDPQSGTLRVWKSRRNATAATAATKRPVSDGEGDAGEKARSTTLPASRTRTYPGSKVASVVVDQRLTAEQRAAIPLLLDAVPNGEVAKTVGVELGEVRAWRRDPVFAGVLSDLVAERRRLVLESIDATVPEAMDYLRDVVAGKVEANKHRIVAAFGILDRGGFPKTERVEHDLPGGNPNADLDRMSPEDLAAEEERLLAQVRDAG